jgi:hypothetical protein
MYSITQEESQENPKRSTKHENATNKKNFPNNNKQEKNQNKYTSITNLKKHNYKTQKKAKRKNRQKYCK